MAIKFELRRTSSWAYSIDEYDKNWEFKETPSQWNKLNLTEEEAKSLSEKYWQHETNYSLDGFYQKIVEYIWIKEWDSLLEDWLSISDEDIDIYDEIIEESITWWNQDIKSNFLIWDSVRTKDSFNKIYWKVSSLSKDEKENVKVLVTLNDWKEQEFYEEELLKVDEKKLKTYWQFINLNSSWKNKESIISFVSKMSKDQIDNVTDIQLVYDQIENNDKINIEDKIDIIWSVQDQLDIEINKRKRELERLQNELNNLNSMSNMWVSIAMREIEKSWEKKMLWSTHKFRLLEKEFVDVQNVDLLPENLKKKIEYFQADKTAIKTAIKNWEKLEWASIWINKHYYVEKN